MFFLILSKTIRQRYCQRPNFHTTILKTEVLVIGSLSLTLFTTYTYSLKEI